MTATATDEKAAMRAALAAVREIHAPVEALNVAPRKPVVTKVCAGCGTDDGNWQHWPCPTVRAVDRAMRGWSE